MATIKLVKKIIYTGLITLKTGLHIGGTNTSLNIGGPDNFVVRNPIDNIPYIPGSSLKGKMRALVEILHGETNAGEPTSSINTKAGALFGVSADSKGHPSRLIVRDSVMLTDLDKDEELNMYGLSRIEIPDFSHTDLRYTESKTETVINRITAESNPRTFERVPAGAIFKLNMVLNIFEGENEESLEATLNQAIKLLEDDYLGGHGSRGYGQVAFKIVKKESKTY